jgi:predicted phage terminase large subunit-like protein
MPAITIEAAEKFLRDNPQYAESLAFKWTKYIPHTPTPKQMAFLVLPHEEAFYGGAAGGGKSDALLMAALQYVDVPGYSALLFRKTLSDLKLPKSLLDRAHNWLRPWVQAGECWWNAGEHSYYFPTFGPDSKPADPARIQFGYTGQMGSGIGGIGVKERYQSAEFQFVGFDELTQFMEEDYTWMFNRLRKSVCPIHKLDKKGRPIYMDDCWWCQTYKSLPVRMRSASNPGNIGHAWVKNRFGIIGVTDDEGETRYIGTNPIRPYIPAFVADNPFIDNEGYNANLDRLDSITRERLKKGDWGVSEDSRFKKKWCRYYSMRGGNYVLGTGGVGPVLQSDRDFQRIFFTVDPAGSSRESPGADKIWKRQASWTVIAIFGLTHDYHLLWLDNIRVQVEIPDIITLLQRSYRRWRPSKIRIEGSGLGKGVYQLALKYGLPVEAIYPHADKLTRATDAMVRMEAGRIWLPEPPGPAWLEPLESELFTWTGDPLMTDDQIDALSYAAMDVSWEAAAVEINEHSLEQGTSTRDFMPGVIHQNPYFGTVPNIGYSDPRIDNW